MKIIRLLRDASLAIVLFCLLMASGHVFGQSGGPATYAQWQQTVFTAAQLNDPAISGPLADPDGDGIVNLMEYASGINPLKANPPTTTYSQNNGYWALIYKRRVAASDIAYVVEVSNDLLNWASGPGYTSQTQAVSSTGGFETILVSDNTPINNAGRRFMRLRIVTGKTLASPSGLVVSAASATANRLSWVNNAADAGGILVERSADGGKTWITIVILDPTATIYNDGSVSQNTSYTYRITALAQNSGAGDGGGGSSLPSGSSTVTPPTSPSPREIVDLQVGKVALSTDVISISASVLNQTDPILSLSLYDVTDGNRTKILDFPRSQDGYSYYYSSGAWSNPTAGIHYLLALATDSLGNTLASPVCRIEVMQYIPPPIFAPYPNPNFVIVTDLDQSALAYYRGTKVQCSTFRDPPPPNGTGWTAGTTSYDWSGKCVDQNGSPNPTGPLCYVDTSATGSNSISVKVTKTWKPNGVGSDTTTTLTDTLNFSVIDVQIKANVQPVSGYSRRVSTDLMGTVPFTLSVNGAKAGDSIRVGCDVINYKVWATQNGTRTRVSPSQLFDATNLPSFEVEASSDAVDFLSQGALFDLTMNYLTSTGVAQGEPPSVSFKHFVTIDVFPKVVPTTGISCACVQIQKLWPDNEGDYAPATVPTKILIKGRPVNNIQQDASDPTTFYISPDTTSSLDVGACDLEVDGLSFKNIPLTNAVVKSGIDVTANVDIGVSSFSTAAVMAVQQAASIASNVRMQGGSTQDAVTAYEESEDSQVPVFSYLLKSFLGGHATDTVVDAELQYMAVAGDNANLYVSFYTGGDPAARASTGSTSSTQSGATPSGVQVPQLGSTTFFADTKSYLASTGQKILQGTLGDTQYAVFSADDFKLNVFDLGAYPVADRPSKIIDDALKANPTAAIVINGAFFNWHANDANAEPLTTIGVVLNNGMVQTTSNVGKPSHVKSDLAYWFGQTFDHSATTNAGHALTYQTGGKGNPPIPAGTTNPTDLNAGTGGLTSFILQDSSGTPFKVKPGNADSHGDTDLNVFASVRGRGAGTGGIGINRANGLLIVFAKASHYTDIFPQTVFDIQTALFNSGVTVALLTDGGASVALAVNGTVAIRESRHSTSSRPPAKQTVTSYLMFNPNN